ncbi:MAG: transporter [Spartobacteria bacterium]|nr:transporter [Spartobacteria bacterium]
MLLFLVMLRMGRGCLSVRQHTWKGWTMNNKLMKWGCLCLGSFLVAAVGVNAEEHYVNGVEGLKAGSLPPPGLYWRVYGAYYTADESMDENGDKQDIGFDLNVYALVNRLIWSTPVEILGGNYVCDLIVPALQVDLKIDAMEYDKDRTGFGDICVEPFVIAWHGSRYDAAVGLSAYLPTGEYDEDEAANPGKGMWTGMLTLGGTYYLDEGRTWSVSALSRYETHSKIEGRDYTPGDDFHFEWGIGKTLAQVWDVGLAGYCQWQVSENKGDEAPYTDKNRVFAVGPEVVYFIQKAGLFASLRSEWEFEAQNHTQGQITVLTLTKIF